MPRNAQPTTPEPLITEFVRLVKALPAPARAVWDRASSRVFDVGFQSGGAHRPQAYAFSPETLLAAAEIGTAITLTIYPSRSDESGGGSG